MILSLSLALLVTVSGALATYIYDEGASLAARLCTGACVGLAAFGLIGFMLASFLGLTPFSIALATVLTAAPFALLLDSTYCEQVQADLAESSRAVRHAISRPTGMAIGYFFYYAIAAVLLWLIFNRAMIELPGGIYTGVLNNFGDLPFHLSVITGFAYGHNFPPEDPTFAGVRFTYPFLTDFVSAVFVRCGADLRDSMFIENVLLAISFVGVLHRWGWEMLRDRVAALLTPLLVLLNGGFGFVLLFSAANKSDRGLIGVLKQLPASFTVIPETTWRWGNAISSLLVPQRGILLGLPLAVIVFTQWWMATRGEDAATQRQTDSGKSATQRRKAKKKHGWGAQKLADTELGSGERRTGNAATVRATNEAAELRASASSRVSPMTRMFAAGVIAGLLPLTHAHSFVVVMGMAACIALLQRRWRVWFAFALVASFIAIPQMWWSTRGSAVHAASFFAWEFGWDHGLENPVWFWFKNTGLFIPLLVAAILWRGKDYLVSRRLLLFYLPFTLCFIIPNVVKLAPWIWDNVKVLFTGGWCRRRWWRCCFRVCGVTGELSACSRWPYLRV